MGPLRIAQVAPYLRPHVGGVESHVETVSAELARRGHDVVVYTSAQPGAPDEERVDGYRIARVRAWANLFTTPVTPGLGRALASAPCDVVHAHSPPPLSAWFAARWAAGARVPFVLTYHCDLEIPLWGGAAVVETYRRTLGLGTVRRADAVVATTRTYAQTSRALWRRSDVDVVPNMVDARRFHPERGDAGLRERHGLGERPVALFVGRLTHHKGVEEFVRAAASTGPDVAHVVVGDGPRRAALEAEARRVAPGRVLFVGRVPAEELPAWYRAADVGVLPSTSRLEAFGIAALECMASGRPVVVSRMPGVEEVVEDGVTGLHADPLDAGDLAAKIVRIARDRELAAAMGKAARARVEERYATEHVVDAIEAVYRRVLRQDR
ncbi:MAG TPA: glycosyltransferase family 4 protein [Candidatus Thermoplasmatota archaeon]|nr:glycosyltransferase family 4 protein [Candidatus Thermoplasmatota archaeon]